MRDPIRILCVDDERQVLLALARIFMNDAYEILTASSGKEGLKLLQAAGQVQVVIADYRMPRMNGVEFLKEVCKSHPDTVRIVISGYEDTASVVASINEGQIYRFIPKPWIDDELRMIVANALKTFEVRRRNAELAEELLRKNEELKELNVKLEQLVIERSTELTRQNRALLRAENVLKRLSVGVVELGPGGVVERINAEASAMLGVGSDRVLGKHIRDTLHALISPTPLAGEDHGSGRSIEVNGTQLWIRGTTLTEEDEEGTLLTLLRVES